ncbi:MAG TPA: murein L,D-transpeptidase catalytic domain family protein [Chitinophagaceae bacterium]|nr:murein L,D-transpeptidase catalytic domain family protein [Chitinophagaceae bacterium]
MFKTRFLLLIFFLVLSFAWLSSSGVWKRFTSRDAVSRLAVHEPDDPWFEKTRIKAEDARRFVVQKGYNDIICFLIDMSLPSGQNRFFIFDLKKDTLKNSGLVTHGRCNESWLEGRKYGNTVGCGCTSLGKYKIGQSYNGRFGLAYKLYGLEKTNDNAYKRFVVLHAHECVPEAEVEDEICQSDGCPTVSTGLLQYIKPIIDMSKKPVLLWIYE